MIAAVVHDSARRPTAVQLRGDDAVIPVVKPRPQILAVVLLLKIQKANPRKSVILLLR